MTPSGSFKARLTASLTSRRSPYGLHRRLGSHLFRRSPALPSSFPRKRESKEAPLNLSAGSRQRKNGDLPIPKFVELACVEPVETSKRTPRLPRPSTLRQAQRRGPITPSPGSSPGQTLSLSVVPELVEGGMRIRRKKRVRPPRATTGGCPYTIGDSLKFQIASPLGKDGLYT